MVRPVDQAVVAHVPKGYLLHPSGVFDQTGAYVHEAVHWRGRPLMVPPPFPETTEHLPGRWLWGGVLMDHFGHFLTESTGRLWALEGLERQIDGIVFLPERGFGRDRDLALKGYQRQFFDLLGVQAPIRILTRATRFDRLEVPGPGFGIGPLMAGTQPFRRFVQARLAPDLPSAGGESLYISRSRLDLRLGGVIAENLLERNLTAAGYEIYHPQDHGLAEQIAAYRAARRIVALDGSALHLVAMAARPGQSVAVIKRRTGSAPEGIAENLAGFTGKAPLLIDAIVRNWIRSDRSRVDNLSYGELDFPTLGAQLAAGGFLPPGSIWGGLRRRRIEGAIAWIEKKLKRKNLTFRPDRPLEADKVPGAGA